MEPTAFRAFFGTAVLTVGDGFYEVHPYVEGEKLKKGHGYYKGNYVYVYRGKLSKVDKKFIDFGIYQDKDGSYTFVEYTGHSGDEFHINNVTDLSLNKIFHDAKTDQDNFIDHQDLEIINNNLDAWVPTFGPDDDFLTYAVKTAIINKKINLKNYKGKFSNQYGLNNLKGALMRSTKMSMPYFKAWCEVLGLSWEMVLFDNGDDRLTPLPNPIELNSEQFL